MSDLRQVYPQFTYLAGELFRWSPTSQTITYVEEEVAQATGQASLLHEIAHALLEHTDFQFDLELLRMEIAAWQKTYQLAVEHGVKLNETAIERCLDTYRDWLFARSRCPQCGQTGLQQASHIYRCLVCADRWRVPVSQTCAIKRYAVV